MFAPPDPYTPKTALSPPGQESVFKTMARRTVPPPRRPPIRQPYQVRGQAPIRQQPTAPGPPQPGTLPPPPQMDPPTLGAPAGMPGTGGGFMAPPPPPGPAGMPGTGGGFQAPPPQATASSADVTLGPNFDAERARRLMIAQRMRSGGGTFQY